MPEGIVATVDNGFATLDFVDKSLRGPALAKLVDIGGPETIETVTRVGPRRQYRVPEGNAREAGLLDEVARGVNADGTPSDSGPGGGTGTTQVHVTSAGQDTGFAAALVAADPNVNAGGDNANWHTPVAEYTSANSYVGQVPNEDVLDRDQVFTGDADSFGGSNAASTPTHREVIDYVKENSPVRAVGGVLPVNDPEPVPLVPVSQLNTALKSQTGALADDPGSRPIGGGEALDRSYTTVQSQREESPQTGQTTETLGKVAVQTQASAGTAEGPGPLTPPDDEDVVEYPQGTPSTDWRRDELDAYALKVKRLDTTTLGNKAEVVAAIKAAK